MPKRRPAEPLLRHLADTRRPLHSLPAVAPLVLAHAALAWLFTPPVGAAAAGWVQAPLLALGLGPFEAALTLALLFVVAGVTLSWRDLRSGRARFRPALVPWIWCEGLLWGLLLHLAWNGLRGGVQELEGVGPLGPGDHLVLALGAGIYEELVFRVGVFWLVRRLVDVVAGRPAEGDTGLGRTLLAVLVTSLLFAFAHHLGPEPFSLGALIFRTVAALVLTSLYAWRGLGVATCAHAAYDVFVVAL